MKNLTTTQWKLFVFIVLVAFLGFFLIPHINKKSKSKETFTGIVLKKYYKRGNTIDVRLYTGEIFTSFISIKDEDFDKIFIGDTVIVTNGSFYKW